MGWFFRKIPICFPCLPFPGLWLCSSRENSPQKIPSKPRPPPKNPLKIIKTIPKKSRKFPPRIPGKLTTTGIAHEQLQPHPEQSNIPKKPTFGRYLQRGKAWGIPNTGEKGLEMAAIPKKPRSEAPLPPQGRGLAPIPAASPRKTWGFGDQRWENPGSSMDLNSVLSSFPLPGCPSSASKNSQTQVPTQLLQLQGLREGIQRKKFPKNSRRSGSKNRILFPCPPSLGSHSNVTIRKKKTNGKKKKKIGKRKGIPKGREVGKEGIPG